LDIDTVDFAESTARGVIACDKLGYNCKGFGTIDELVRTEEGLITHTPRVKVTTIFIADSIITMIRVITTLGSFTSGLSFYVTDVWSNGSSGRVGFPYVHFSTTGSVVTSTRVRIIRRWFPVNNVGFTVNEFNIVGALGITVSSSVLSSGLVERIFRHSTISRHLYKV